MPFFILVTPFKSNCKENLSILKTTEAKMILINAGPMDLLFVFWWRCGRGAWGELVIYGRGLVPKINAFGGPNVWQ